MLSVAFLLALVLGLSLVPVGIRLARATGYLDHPHARKLHASATPLLGGVVVFACTAAAWIVADRVSGAPAGWEAARITSGATLALAIGMWDDRFGMPPAIKLAGQVAAALLLVDDTLVAHIGLPGPLDTGFTAISVVALLNAVNFLDNMNGMVGGITAVAMIAFGWDSASRGDLVVAAAQLALAGACLGFLRYNFPSGRLFLGDAGSLLLGYSLAASGLLAYRAAPGNWARIGPILMLGYPVFDMVFVVVTRLREGRKVYVGGKDHSNHRLASVLRCQKRTVTLTWAVGAALSVSGLVVLRLNRAVPSLLLLGLWTSLFLVAGVKLSSVPVANHTSPRNDPLPTGGSPSPRT